MKNLKKRTSLTIKILPLLLAAVFLLMGCSPIAVQDGTQKAVVMKSAQAEAEELKPVVAAGGEIYIAMPEDIASFDPFMATNEDLINILGMIYESPLTTNMDGTIRNVLIDRYETDETGTIFTFYLKDAVFSDGVTPLTADDIVYSAKKAMSLAPSSARFVDAETMITTPEGAEGEASAPPSESPSATPSESPSATPSESPSASAGASATASSTAGTVSDALKMIPQTSRYAIYNDKIAQVEKVDDKTIRVTQTQRGDDALYFMMFPVMSETFSGHTLPVGTGAYKMDSFTNGTEMTLSPNEYWHGNGAIIEKIVAKPMDGNNKKMDAIGGSLVDLVMTDALNADKLKTEDKISSLDYMTNYYDCLVPNLMNNSLKDVNVRQAISYGIDRREIISTVLLNHAVPANIPIPPDFYAYNSKYKVDDDRTLAKQLLAQSGYKTSEEDILGTQLSLKILLPIDKENSYRREAAKAIRKQLLQLGIIIELEEVDPVTYIERLKLGQFELAYCSYFLDESIDLDFMLGTNGEMNYGFASSPEIETALAAAAAAVSQEEKLQAYDDLQLVLTNRCPQIGLLFRTHTLIFDDSIGGIGDLRQLHIYDDAQAWHLTY